MLIFLIRKRKFFLIKKKKNKKNNLIFIEKQKPHPNVFFKKAVDQAK